MVTQVPPRSSYLRCRRTKEGLFRRRAGLAQGAGRPRASSGPWARLCPEGGPQLSSLCAKRRLINTCSFPSFKPDAVPATGPAGFPGDREPFYCAVSAARDQMVPKPKTFRQRIPRGTGA